MNEEKDSRKKEMIKEGEKLLRGAAVDGIVGVRQSETGSAPFLFVDPSDLSGLVVEHRFDLASLCRVLQNRYPDKRFGVFARGCDERALLILEGREKIDLDKLTIVGIACSPAEAEACCCNRPYPRKAGIGRGSGGVEAGKISKEPPPTPAQVLAFWGEQFSKCIKCYGCRDVCPVCFCEDCALEDSLWVKGGKFPPPMLTFHFLRAFHVADKCAGCGACESVCPVDIPLGKIHRAVRDVMAGLFDFEAGVEEKRESPLLTSLKEDPVREE